MKKKILKIIALILCFSLIFEQSGFAQIAGQLDLSGYFSGLRSSFAQDKFRPLHLRYLSYDNVANTFKLLLDKGDTAKGLSPKGALPLEETTKTLLKYVFIGITLPNESFWVNLRPDSPENIIDPYLAQTDIGKILLEADVQLKKDTALATSPQTPEGRKYWDRLYKKAEELFGYDNITIPTLTRPWIVPGEIIIRETPANAYIYKATLKVMLEQDYLKDSATYNFKDPRLKALNEYSSQLIRELIIPKLTKEVNSSKKYAALRQVYYSLILAQWFKMRFYGRGGLYSWLIDKRKLNGLTSQERWNTAVYFNAYQQSFKDGEYNIQEPRQNPFGQTVRSYFSGGIMLAIRGAVAPGGELSGSAGLRLQSVAGSSSRDGALAQLPNLPASFASSNDLANPADGALEVGVTPAQNLLPAAGTDSSGLYAVAPEAAIVLALVNLAASLIEKIRNHQSYQEELDTEIISLIDKHGIIVVRKAAAGLETGEVAEAINEAVDRQSTDWRLQIDKLPTGALSGLSPQERAAFLNEVDSLIRGISRSTWLKIIKNISELPHLQWEDMDSEPSLHYVPEGRNKYVFKLVLRLKNAGEINILLATKFAAEEDSITDRELEYNQKLQGTAWVPKLGGSFKSANGRVWYIEEFISGPTVGDDAQKKGVRIDPEAARKCIKTLLDILFYLNPGKTEDFIGPSDFHRHNFIIDANDPGQRVVLVDFGEPQVYETIGDFLFGVVMYYGGVRGEHLDYLREELSRFNFNFDDKGWSAMLEGISRQAHYIITRKINTGQDVAEHNGFYVDKSDCNKAIGAIIAYRHNKRAGQDDAREASTQAQSQGNGKAKIISLKKTDKLNGQISFGSYRYDSAKGTIAIGDEIAVSGVEIYEAGGNWFTGNGLKGNAVIAVYEDFRGEPRIAIIIKAGLSEEERNKAFRHELIALMRMEGEGVQAGGRIEDRLGHDMAATGAGETPTTLDLITPEELEAALKDLPRDRAIVVATQRPLSQGEASARPQPLRITDTDILQENIATGKLEARNIAPLFSFASPELEEAIRQEIADRINNNKDTDALRRYLSVPQDWLNAQAQEIIEKFNLERDGIQDASVKLALDKACAYFKEVFPAEESLLSRLQESHRFLVPGHWLVNALQQYIDRMAGPGFPRLRLLIAVDAEEPIAATVGQSIIISLSLIARLDTIDEVVAVLAHEQGHPEFNLTHGRQGSYGGPVVTSLQEISAMRLREHEADWGTEQKLSALGLHPLALAEALRKIAGPRSQQAVTHGNVSRRILVLLAALKHHDLEHAGSPSGEVTPIPPSWKPASIIPSIEERLLYKNHGRDFKRAVSQASPGMRAAVMKELLKTITGGVPNRMIRQPAQKYGYMLYYLEKQAQEEARVRRWGRNRADLLFFSWLEDIHGSTSDDDFLKLKLNANRSARRAHYQIKRAALSMLRQAQQPGASAVFNSLISDSYRDRPIAAYNLTWALEVAVDMLIADTQLGQRFFGRDYNIDNESFLTIFNPCLQAVGELQEALNPGIHSDSLRSNLTAIVNLYCDNFRQKHGFLQDGRRYLSPQDFAELIRQLKKAEVAYEATFGLEAFLETAFNNDYDFRNKLPHLTRPSMSEDEIKSMLFNTRNALLERCLGFLRSRDAEGFLEYLRDNAAAKAFYEFLGRGYEPSIKLELQRLFKDEPGLETWIYECLQRFWQGEAFISEEGLIDQICSGSPEWNSSGAAGEEDKSFAQADGSDIDHQDRQRLAQFLYGLDIILALPVPFAGGRARATAIERYLQSDNALALLGRLPLVYLNRVMSRLSGRIDPRNGVGDHFLGLSVYSLARSRVIKIIQDAPPADLKLLSDIYWGIIHVSHHLYPNPTPAQKHLRAVGQTEDHSQWLLPLNQAYYAFLENNLEGFLNDPEVSIQSFFELDAALFDSQEKTKILDAYALTLIDRLPEEALRDFLLRLVRELKITREIYDYFLEKRIKTQEDFLYFKQARDEEIAQVVAGGDLKLTAAVLADSVLDHLGEEQTIELFRALLGPEKELRQKAVYLWFLQSLLRGPLMDYKIEKMYGGPGLAVTGDGKNNFMPFEEFMEDLYNAPELVKIAILEKLLLGPNGLLHTRRGKRAFVDILRRYVPVSRSSSGPLADITRASVGVLDAEEIFLGLASSLSALILKRPSGGRRQLDDADELGAALSSQLKRLNKSLLTGTGGRISLWEYSHQTGYSEFLQAYPSRLPTGELQLRVEPLAASLAGKLKARLGVTAPVTQAAITPRQQQVQIIDIIMRACQSLGPMGYRFLQIYGQYVDIPSQMQDRFLDVYDSSEGQDKFSAFTTLLSLADRDDEVGREVRRFVDEDLVSIDEKIGGGAIVTVFKITVRNRDEHGNLTDGVHQEVLKIRVPNAELLVNETADKLLEIVERLQRSARGKDKRYYLAARRVLQDVREWVIQDIRDNTFWELDSLYRQAHAGYAASNGMQVSVAPALQPNNKDIKREAFVSGPTLNKVLKWKSAGKTLAQIVAEEQDPALKEFLLNLQKQGRTLDDILKQATQALVEDYARLMAQPLTHRGGRDIYILHSDMHFGNAIISPDLSTVYPIDRNFYLQLHKQDVDFIRGLMTKDRTQAAQILEEIVNYFLGLPQNQNTSFNRGTFSGMRRWLLLRSIGVKVLLQRNKDPFTVMTKVLQELESRGIEIPLSIRIMFKNLLAINAMLRHAQAGSFEDYIRGAPAAGAPVVAMDQAERARVLISNLMRKISRAINAGNMSKLSNSLKKLVAEIEKDYSVEKLLGQGFSREEAAIINAFIAQYPLDIIKNRASAANSLVRIGKKAARGRAGKIADELKGFAKAVREKVTITTQNGSLKIDVRLLNDFNGFAESVSPPHLDNGILEGSSTEMKDAIQARLKAGNFSLLSGLDDDQLGQCATILAVTKENDTARRLKLFLNGCGKQDPDPNAIEEIIAFIRGGTAPTPEEIERMKKQAAGQGGGAGGPGIRESGELGNREGDATPAGGAEADDVRSGYHYVAASVNRFMGFQEVDSDILPGEHIDMPERLSKAAFSEWARPENSASRAWVEPLAFIKYARNCARIITSVVQDPKVYYIGLGSTALWGYQLNFLLPLLKTDFTELIGVEIEIISFEEFQRLTHLQLDSVIDAGTEIEFRREGENTFSAQFRFLGKTRVAKGYFGFDGTAAIPQEVRDRKRPCNVFLTDVSISNYSFLRELFSLLDPHAGFFVGGTWDVSTAKSHLLDYVQATPNYFFLEAQSSEMLLNDFFVEVNSLPFYELCRRIFWIDYLSVTGWPQHRPVILATKATARRLLEDQSAAASATPSATPSAAGEAPSSQKSGPAANTANGDFSSTRTGSNHNDFSASEPQGGGAGNIGKGPGGIDFRQLPIVTQPVGTLGGDPSLRSGLPAVAVPVNLDKEWSEIEQMLKAGIKPSTNRIKEYVGACIQKEDMDGEIDKVLSCIADILRQEEQECSPTEPALRELLVLLDSDKPAQDMAPALMRIQPLPKEPKNKQN